VKLVKSKGHGSGGKKKKEKGNAHCTSVNSVIAPIRTKRHKDTFYIVKCWQDLSKNIRNHPRELMKEIPRKTSRMES